MYYCFVHEDLAGLGQEDPLMLQVGYAKRLGLYCCCHLSQGTIRNSDGAEANLAGRKVFLRATCHTADRALALLESRNITPLESAQDLRRIEHWDSMSLTRRCVFTVELSDLLAGIFLPPLAVFLRQIPRVFIKSRRKGFSATLPAQRLLQMDSEIFAFFMTCRLNYGAEQLLLCQALTVTTDSLGARESRHFVLDGMIANSSRPLHSVRHTVPGSQYEMACRMVSAIAARGDFPRNYVLDVGEFEQDGVLFSDVVELNPITTSLCYVNNSIFTTETAEVTAFKRKNGMGAEYCFDALSHPDRYVTQRYANQSYGYTNQDHYHF